MTGRVVHFEIPAEDLPRAREFYRSAFGWNLDEMPEMDYTMIRTTATDDQGMPIDPGAINGGMFQRTKELPGPVIVIDVEDIDKALEVVGNLGGSTLSPRQAVGEVGWAAYFKDPEGNVVGLWQTAPA